MNKLLEIKDKAVKFYGEYENYIFPVIKFVIAFAAFLTIDLNIGYMTQLIAGGTCSCSFVCTFSAQYGYIYCIGNDIAGYVCALD